jgi:PPK2 family polyphosphate:nucleotide phosphotransferase
MKRYQIKPGQKVSLKDWSPDPPKDFEGGKETARADVVELNRKLEVLQERLFAERRHKVLVILQGMDTSGKDGVIRSVFDGVNPQGVKVASFKVPTPEELDHDYLWRVHKVVPGRGEMVIFNRSHYEDVLVVRVHQLVPPEIWKKRYDQINEFERLLWETGTTILKFFLFISKEEQKQRLLERLADPAKHWKFNPGDLKERALWDEYEKAYEDVLSRTSTEYAPWYLVPADKKWYRDWVISRVLVETLENLNIRVPPPLEDAETYRHQLLEEDERVSP